MLGEAAHKGRVRFVGLVDVFDFLVLKILADDVFVLVLFGDGFDDLVEGLLVPAFLDLLGEGFGEVGGARGNA